MTGLSSAVSAALSGLNDFAEGIGAVGNNIANQSTEGYATRSVETQTARDRATAAGAGVVDPALVKRVSDSLQAANVYRATAANSAAGARAAALKAIDQAFTGNGDIQGAASTFFADLGTLASDPTNAAQISTVLADAQGLSGTFNSAAGALSQQNVQIGTQVAQQVAEANTLLGQIAKINTQLAAAPGDPSLLDQQQATLTKLSFYMDISTLPLGDNGALAVMTGGTVLVDQAGAQDMTVTQPMPTDLPTLTAGREAQPMKLSSTGGSLGGLLASFAATANAGKQLDWTAGTIAGLVNQSQAEGLNGNGTLGAALFATPAPTVAPGAGNTGAAVLTPQVTNSSALPPNGQGYTLTYSASGWTATVPGTAQSYALGATSPLTLNGMNIAVTGAANPGDTFQVAPEPGAAAAMRVTTANPADLAVADPYVMTAGTVSASGQVTNVNAGTISEGSDSVTTTPDPGAAVVPASSFGDKLELQFTSGSAYNVVDTTTSTTVATGSFGGGSTNVAVAYPAGSPSAGTYWQVTLTGAPAAGDVATLSPAGLNSGSNAQRMSDLWRRTDAALPGGSVEGAVGALIGGTGANAAAAATLSDNTATNLSTAQSDLSKVAGVNLDTQAEQLSEYQQAYQAAAKVITAAEAMFKSLINAI